MNNEIFNKNLEALAIVDQSLHSRLSKCEVSRGSYRFLDSRCGRIVPAFVLDGETRPLHSLFDCEKEAVRLISSLDNDLGFLILLGLGGGYIPQAALTATGAFIVIIDYDCAAIAQLFSHINYSSIINNNRVKLLVDPSLEDIRKCITENYLPALHGGIKVMPLRPRTDADTVNFPAAAQAVEDAIQNISADFSVQSLFGKRWFSNIIRNIRFMDTAPIQVFSPKYKNAAIIAAGPSLDKQIPDIAQSHTHILCTDTALPVLLHHGINPDIIISIDCQHISYYHFMGCNARNIPVFIDIASPPLLSGFAHPLYFSGGHPLTRYYGSFCRNLPVIDTSGGNVTYACLSLAEYLGFERITLFGADFAYIGSRTYARGTYIYPFFAKKQNRLGPMESLLSRFLYRSRLLSSKPLNSKPLDSKLLNSETGCYETAQLRFYRQRLEEKIQTMKAHIELAPGQGAPINIKNDLSTIAANTLSPFKTAGKENRFTYTHGRSFLEQYRADIAALCGKDVNSLSNNQRTVFTTLLPYTAVIKKHNPNLQTTQIIEKTIYACLKELDLLLH
jgi:hypothetical protein